jgi:hypothetical protein
MLVYHLDTPRGTRLKYTGFKTINDVKKFVGIINGKKIHISAVMMANENEIVCLGPEDIKTGGNNEKQ